MFATHNEDAEVCGALFFFRKAAIVSLIDSAHGESGAFFQWCNRWGAMPVYLVPS
jgi:hypothetical protein